MKTKCINCGFYESEEEKWHTPSRLPPVEVPLIIFYKGQRVNVVRKSYASSSDARSLIYTVSEDNSTIEGKFPWMIT